MRVLLATHLVDSTGIWAVLNVKNVIKNNKPTTITSQKKKQKVLHNFSLHVASGSLSYIAISKGIIINTKIVITN